MMKKTIFGKFLAIAMLFAGFSLTSCDEKDNAIIDGKVYVKPEMQLVDGGVVIKATTISDINRMLARIRKEMYQATLDGESFTIDIQSAELNSTVGDNTLNIDTSKDGDIIINLPSNIITEAPLIIEKLGVADDATAGPSDNKVEINFPSNSSNLDLGINLPTSTVTLKGGTFNNVAATTGWNTLVIEKDVTVNWLKINGGNAVVKDGGKVLGALTDNYFEVKKEGICINELWKNEVPTTKPTDEDFFYVNKAKILKREDGDRVYFNVWQYPEDPKNEVEIVIADGARAETHVNASTPNYRPTITILGEGDAKLIGSGYKDGEGKIHPDNWYIPLSGIKTMTGVTADATHCLVFNDETKKYEYLEIDEEYSTEIHTPQNAKDCKFYATQRITAEGKGMLNNCALTAMQIDDINPNCENTTFKGEVISFTNRYVSGNSATVKNCKFEALDKEDQAQVTFPYQTKDRSSFNFGFDTCEFGKGFKFYTSYEGREPWLDKDGKPVTKAYYWWVLNDDGSVKTDPYTEKRSVDEKDIPAANKANGKTNGSGWWDDTIGEWGGWVYSNGYWLSEDPNGLTEDAYYKDYKGYLTLKNSTLDGKAITSKTDMIGSVGYGRNEKGEQATKTYYVIDGTTYEALYSYNDKKFILVETE